MNGPSRFALALLAAPLLVASSPAAAADRPFEVTLVVEPAASYSDYSGFDFDPGYGLALGWRFSELWTVELRGMRQPGDSSTQSLDLDSFQLGLRRAFDLASAWRPAVLAGVHYQSEAIEAEVVCLDAAGVAYPCPERREERDGWGAFVGGGVDWRFSTPAALRFDARLALYDSEATGDLEQALDVTAGLVLSF